MVSPHFPPDTSAGTHRVRLIAPHLPAFGFEPTVLTVDPRDCEGRLDWDLEKLVPPELRVVRTRAWSTRWTRVMRVGDLGLRAYWGLRRAALDLLLRETFDCVFITIYPTYPALMGPALKRKGFAPVGARLSGSVGWILGPDDGGRQERSPGFEEPAVASTPRFRARIHHGYDRDHDPV